MVKKLRKIESFLSVVKLMTKYKEMITSWNAKEIAAAANWLVED